MNFVSKLTDVFWYRVKQSKPIDRNEGHIDRLPAHEIPRTR